MAGPTLILLSTLFEKHFQSDDKGTENSQGIEYTRGDL